MEDPEAQQLPCDGVLAEYQSTRDPIINFSFTLPNTNHRELDEGENKDALLDPVCEEILDDRLKGCKIEGSEQEEQILKEDPPRQPTTSIYHHSAHIRSYNTRVISVEIFEELPEAERQLFGKQYVDYPTPLHCIVTEDTIFYPQSGGQPSDTGTMSNDEITFHVLQVRNTTGKCVLHLGEFSDASETFSAGGEIEQRIDEERRNLNSVYHTAGHILQDAVHQLNPELEIEDHEVLKAHFFPSGSYVEFKGLIASYHKELIQEKIGGLVEQNLEVLTHWWDEDELSENKVFGLNRFESSDEKTRVTVIEGLSASACCGTHVNRTGDVGKILLCGFRRRHGKTSIGYKIEPNLHA